MKRSSKLFVPCGHEAKPTWVNYGPVDLGVCSVCATKNVAAQELERRGGRKTAQRGRAYYSALGKRSAAKRWGYCEHEWVSEVLVTALGQVIGPADERCVKCKTWRLEADA